jgi:hypothetical protein
LDDAGALLGRAAERVPAGNRSEYQFADGQPLHRSAGGPAAGAPPRAVITPTSGKRLVKSPKVYVRDSGLLHALLSVPTMTALNDHPIIGPS